MYKRQERYIAPPSVRSNLESLAYALRGTSPILEKHFRDKEAARQQELIAEGERLQKETGKLDFAEALKEHPEYEKYSPYLQEGFEKQKAIVLGVQYNQYLTAVSYTHLQELRDKGHSRLFEELNPTCADKKYTTLYSKWFNRHLKSDLKIKGNKRTGAKVFYSFRHTFINYCVQHGIDDRYFERVVGHALEGNPITYAHYAKALSPKILKAEVLDKVDYEIDLTCLRDNPFARTGQ